jgi:hypothetical protein
MKWPFVNDCSAMNQSDAGDLLVGVGAYRRSLPIGRLEKPLPSPSGVWRGFGLV